MKIQIKYILLATLSMLVFGCASSDAVYVESGGSRSVVTTNKINIADWNNAAAALVNDMLSSGCLEKFKQPVKMQVSRVINRTSQTIDTDMLTKQISIALNNSGKVQTMSDDPTSKELAEYEAFMANSKVPAPKITMTGKIIEDRDDNSSVKEVTYVFMLEINSGGNAIWQGQKQISKQSDKGWF